MFVAGLRPKSMPGSAEDLIVRNLIEALERLQEDLDRVELWTTALGSFHRPVPDYRPSDQHLLPDRKPQQAGR